MIRAILASLLLSAPTTAQDSVPDGLSTGDWTSIRDAYEAGRHAAYPVEGGFQARNPGQRLLTRFDERGFLIEPDAGSWTWGLELQSYGFDGEQYEVTSPAHVSAEGGRVTYDWSAYLDEWYVNDTRGLEHGYTVRRRPARDTEHEECPLTFVLAVRGKLQPDVLADGLGVRFVDQSGVAVITYTGLAVFDADGQQLEVAFRTVGDWLLLSSTLR